MATFNVQGNVIEKSTELSVPFAKVEIFEVDPVSGGFKSDITATVVTDIDGSFSVNFEWPYDIAIHTNRPDIIFRIVQVVGGVDKVIYTEDPATQTRWNIGDYLSVTLEVEEDCVAINPPPSGQPYDLLFVFTRIGKIGTNDIDTVGPGASGYAFPDINPSAPNSVAANTPFGRTLDVAGWFGKYTDVVRYKIRYSLNGAPFQDIADPLHNHYYEFAPTGGKWMNASLGPFAEGGQSNVYIPTYVHMSNRPWTFPDLLARWDTTKVANGLVTLEIQGFKWDATHTSLVPAASLLIDPNYGVLRLLIDNSPPTVEIKEDEIKHDSTKVKVCDIVDFTGKLKIKFEASDAAGHLRSYALNAMYGHNKYVSPKPADAADTYSSHIDGTRKWSGSGSGGTFTAEYDAAVYDATKMPTCAYQFRLSVSKRTSNGYGLIYHHREDTIHITLKH